VFAVWAGFDTGVGSALRVSGAGGLSFLGLCLFAAVASAQSDPQRTEIFTGFEASDNYASGYVGAGYAFGKAGLYERGFRLRAVGAFGRYHYDGTLLTDGVYVPTTFDGEDAFVSALVGYQFRPGRLIVKLFAGLEAEDQHIVPHDPNNSVRPRTGAQAARRNLARCLAEIFCLGRRLLRHRLPGILQPRAAWASRAAAPVAWARRRRARQ
jgi:hypothetical protein